MRCWSAQPVVLQLDEELITAEDVLQAPGQLEGARLIAREQRLQYDPAEATGCCDQTPRGGSSSSSQSTRGL